MTDRVHDIIRRRNSVAIQKRDAWRARYKLLVKSIQQAKLRNRLYPLDHQTKIELEGLQTLAQIMMTERMIIGMDLRDSAYKWI
jgi:hypothetical protein